MAKRRTRTSKPNEELEIVVVEAPCCEEEQVCKCECDAALKARVALAEATTMQELIDAKKIGELKPVEIYEACQRIQAINAEKAK